MNWKLCLGVLMTAWLGIAGAVDGRVGMVMFPGKESEDEAKMKALKERWNSDFGIGTFTSKNSKMLPEAFFFVCPVKERGNVVTTPIVLMELALPAEFERFRQEMAGRETATELVIQPLAEEWRGLPIAWDAVMAGVLALLPEDTPKSSVRMDLSVFPPWEPGVAQWNFYALTHLLLRDDFDRVAARGAYLYENFGPAAQAMREYFRVGERAYLTAAALSGIERPVKVEPTTVFTAPVLDCLQQCLEQARQATVADTIYRANVEGESNRFRAARRNLEALLEARIRRLYAEPQGARAGQLLVTREGDEAPVKTTVGLEADADYLYLSFDAEEPQMGALKTVCGARDESGMWDDDGFEIFLMPDAAHPEDGYQFIVNAKGAVWDGKRTATQCDVNWNAAGIKTEAGRTATGWSLRLMIPWTDFGMAGRPEGPWRANFYRNRLAGTEREAYYWSPVVGAGYYQPDHFGWLHWKK